MTNVGEYWIVLVPDDGKAEIKNYESLMRLAEALRALVEAYKDRDAYMFVFRGNRLMVTKGTHKYLLVPDSTPNHYALFDLPGNPGETDDEGKVCSAPVVTRDHNYEELTSETGSEDDSDEDELTESSEEPSLNDG